MKNFSTHFSAAKVALSISRSAGSLLTTGLFFSTLANAQAQQQLPTPALFQEDAAARSAATESRLAAALLHARPLTLAIADLRAALANAPVEGQSNKAPLLLALPLPNGTSGRFQVVESSVMEARLAAQFPAIKTYSGVGLDDPTATVRLDLTPRGFHAQVLSGAGSTVYIDPVSETYPTATSAAA
jgi:hypothetical protein